MNLWQGKNIKLRGACEDDYRLYENFRRDTDSQKLYEKIEFPINADSIRESIKRANENNGDDFLFVMENVDGEIVGQIVTFDCDKRMGNFKFGLFVLPAYQGKGYAKEAVNIVLDYYFNHLRYHKANVYIYDCNEKSQKFHQSLGFVREGVLRETSFFDGEYHDTVYYGIIDREFNGRK